MVSETGRVIRGGQEVKAGKMIAVVVIFILSLPIVVVAALIDLLLIPFDLSLDYSASEFLHGCYMKLVEWAN